MDEATLRQHGLGQLVEALAAQLGRPAVDAAQMLAPAWRAGAASLSPEALTVCAQVGLSPSAFAAQLAGRAMLDACSAAPSSPPREAAPPAARPSTVRLQPLVGLVASVPTPAGLAPRRVSTHVGVYFGSVSIGRP